MVNPYDRLECFGLVATIATVSGGNMRHRFPLGNHAIVATDASPDDLGMIDDQARRKTALRRTMTGFAAARRSGVERCFSGHAHPVMAVCAATRERMVKGRKTAQNGKAQSSGGVTNYAIDCRADMTLWFAHGQRAVVTACAGAMHFVMVHAFRRLPACVGMAGTTAGRTGNMSARFTRSGTVVVTGAAFVADKIV